MKYAFDVKISDHMYEDKLKQLFCIDNVIAREGEQEYYEDDVLNNGSYDIIKVKRPWEEVKKSIPSFEGKPIIDQHPIKSVDITIDNIDEYRLGHIQNVREGTAIFEGEEIRVLRADLVFNKKEVIPDVKSGKRRELSCGYFYEIDKNTMSQVGIEGEHVALLSADSEGRAGIARIMDHMVLKPDDTIKLNSPEKYEGIIQSNEGKIKNIKKVGDEAMVIATFGDIIITEKLESVSKIKGLDSFDRQFIQSEVELMQIAYDTVGEIGALKVLQYILEKVHNETDEEINEAIKNKDASKFDNIMRKYHILDDFKDDEEKAEDIDIPEDDLNDELSFEEEDVVWTGIKVSQVQIGDLVSGIRSHSIYEVKDVQPSEDGKSSKLSLSAVDDRNYTTTWNMYQDQYLDLLVDAKTLEKITFNKKSHDESFTTLANVKVGDTLIESNDEFKITDIVENEDGTVNIISNDQDLYIGAELTTKVNIK